MAEVNVRVSDSGRLFPDAVVIKVDEQEIIAGQDGISPVVTVTEIGTAEAVSSHGYEVDVSDAAGVHTYSVYDGASAYAQAVAGGYSGTEEEFAADLIGFNTRAAEATAGATAAAAYADAASDSATAAATSESNAADSATAAASSASEAASSAGTATTAAGSASSSATAAAGSATTASNKASEAASSESNAASSATAASASAMAAAASETAAASSASSAAGSATAAAASAAAIEEYEHDAEAWAIGKRGGADVPSTDDTYHNNSKYYAEQAAASSTTASSAASAASQSAQDAAASATAASQSKDNAASSATAAAGSATAAAGSASTASTAATTAQGHATNAASSATAASGSATAAANKATAAAQSATAAGNSATEAATAREAAEGAQDAAEAAAQSIAQSAAQIAQNTSDIADLKDAVDTLQPAATAADIGKALIVKTVADGKPTEYEYGEAGGGGDATNYAPIIINSASGEIASFADGADGLPVKALSVNVEPIQDLHGYDSPWPAGGGKNLLPVNRITSEVNGITITINKDSAGNLLYINVNGTSTGVVNFNLCGESSSYVLPLPAGSYIVTSQTTDNNVKLRVGNSNNQYMGQATTGAYNLTADGNGNTFQINIDSGKTINNVKIYPMIRLSSVADDTFAPYSNNCPISGRTSATVTRTGKNLFDKSKFQNLATNYEYIGQSYRCKAIQLTPNTVYTVSQSSGIAESTPILLINNKAAVNDTGYFDCRLASHTRTYTTDETGCLYIGTLGSDSATNARIDVCNIQIELGSTASAYEPYTGNTYTIQLGDTVYGGTDEVIGGNGTSTMGMVDLGTLDWYKQTNATKTYFQSSIEIPDMKKSTGNGIIQPIMCSQYKAESWSHTLDYAGYNCCICEGYKNHSSIAIYDEAYLDATAADFKTAMSGVQLCYELATPIEITITATQIDTLLGTNNVWSDAGAVDVDYRADTKLYIDNIHQPTDDDMTADAQIASGKYFIVGGNLYKSTTVIPAGDTIIPETNCVKTNLAEALNALNA